MDSLHRTARLTGVVVLIVALAGGVVSALVLAADVVLLLFLGVLFGIFLTKTTHFVQQLLPLPRGWCLAAIVLALMLMTVLGFSLFGVQMTNRLDGASKQLDSSMRKVEDYLRQTPIAMQAFRKLPFASTLLSDPEQPASRENAPSGRQGESSDETRSAQVKGENERSADQEMSAGMLQSAAGKVVTVVNQMLSTTFGVAANLGVIFFIGLFLAVDPPLYRDGFSMLFPPAKRNRIIDVLNRVGAAMFRWLMGRFLAMAITGLGTALALLALGVPMATMVGVVTGLLTFVPNIGAIISLALAMLMALSQGPATAAWVLALYIALQLVESNIITPLVQQRQTSIPPALLLATQIVFGALLGFLGILVSTPLLAGGLVVIDELWVKDVLGDEDGMLDDSQP